MLSIEKPAENNSEITQVNFMTTEIMGKKTKIYYIGAPDQRAFGLDPDEAKENYTKNNFDEIDQFVKKRIVRGGNK